MVVHMIFGVYLTLVLALFEVVPLCLTGARSYPPLTGPRGLSPGYIRTFTGRDVNPLYPWYLQGNVPPAVETFQAALPALSR